MSKKPNESGSDGTMSEDKPKKKQKIVYIDDGSTVADMSGTFGKNGPQPKSTFKERAKTFFTVAKKMVIPLLITLMALTLVYILLLVLTGRF